MELYACQECGLMSQHRPLGLSPHHCLHCGRGHQPRRATQSPALSTGPLVHLCFLSILGMMTMAVTAPSIVRVPLGMVTGLSCLTWILVFERWPCWFHSAFYGIYIIVQLWSC